MTTTQLAGGIDPTTPEPDIRQIIDSIGTTDALPGGPAAVGTTAVKAGLISRKTLNRLQSRPDWHHIATPPAVTEAWDAIAPLLERLDALADLEATYDAEERAEVTKAKTAAKEAIEAGKPAPTVKPTDWTSKRATLRAEGDALVELVKAKRADYQQTVTDNLPAWREALIALHRDIAPTVRETWSAFVAAFNEHQTYAGVLATMNAELDPEWIWPHSTAAASITGGTKDAIGKLTALVQTDNEIASGTILHHPVGIRPTYAERYAMAEAARREMGPGAPVPGVAIDLFRIEHAEGFEVTAFTEGLSDRLAHLVTP